VSKDEHGQIDGGPTGPGGWQLEHGNGVILMHMRSHRVYMRASGRSGSTTEKPIPTATASPFW
jgi:hypothetical protein